MIKRTLFFQNAVCLTLKNKQLVILNKENGKETSMPIEDIGFIIIENQQTYISLPVLTELVNNNAAVVFCDEKHMPCSMNLPLDCNSIQNQLFSHQISASVPIKKNCWKMIIEQKIKNQALLLEKYGYDSTELFLLAKNVKSDDSTNREALAAKKYWDELFGNLWNRSRFGDFPNNLLNYGYAILRAATARALIGSGLLPTFGIHHHNKYNAYALADDIMEPYRPFVDDCIYEYLQERNTGNEISTAFKKRIMQILTADCRFGKNTRPLMVGLSFTTCSLGKIFMGKSKRLALPEFIP